MPPAAPTGPDRRPDLSARGVATIYRLFDVGYEIDLVQGARLLEPRASERQRPRRAEGRALVLPNPPLTAVLDVAPVPIEGTEVAAHLSVACFDFGVVSLRLTLDPQRALSWPEWEAFGQTIQRTDLTPYFERQLERVLGQLDGAVIRPARAPVYEDYIVFRLLGLVAADGSPVPPTTLRRSDLVVLLLNETKSLSPSSRRSLLPSLLSYSTADAVVLSWDNALVIEPDPADRDVELMIEFANAQLLELRLYDTMLDAELPKMHARIQAVRARRGRWFTRRYLPLLVELQTIVADATDLIERVDNALKVTNDVYLAQVYRAALRLFREEEWRRGVDRKMALLRDTYAMLEGEAQAHRAEALEVIVVILILSEILLSFIR